MNTKYYVIGSINMDMTAYVSHFPVPGETIIGNEMLTLPGGKGANQAVALARLGASTMMFGKIGNDSFGKRYGEILQKEAIDYTHIETIKETSTGIALIEVDINTAQNRIIVIPGANSYVDNAYIEQSVKHILHCAKEESDIMHIVLFQLEIPLTSVQHGLSLLSAQKNIIKIFDPAPAPRDVSLDEIYPFVDFITPNETEAKILTSIAITSSETANQAGQILIEKGCSNVILKVGKRGAYFISKHECTFVEQWSGINAIDTTAAGDSFNAGFAYALGEKKSIRDAILFANQVAGLSTTKEGAQKAMPTLEKIHTFFMEPDIKKPDIKKPDIKKP